MCWGTKGNLSSSGICFNPIMILSHGSETQEWNGTIAAPVFLYSSTSKVDCGDFSTYILKPLEIRVLTVLEVKAAGGSNSLVSALRYKVTVIIYYVFVCIWIDDVYEEMPVV